MGTDIKGRHGKKIMKAIQIPEDAREYDVRKTLRDNKWPEEWAGPLEALSAQDCDGVIRNLLAYEYDGCGFTLSALSHDAHLLYDKLSQWIDDNIFDLVGW